MKTKGGIVVGAVCAILAGVIVVAQVYADNTTPTISTDVSKYAKLPSVVKMIIKPPKITQPAWLKKQIEAEKRVAATQAALGQPASKKPVVVSYSIQTRGKVTSSLGEFKTLVQQTLSDSRGWSGLGITFNQVSSGGSFNLILAQAEEIGKASSGCSSEWSCRVGTSVFINDDRWSGATDAWNSAGGTLRDYRHMVVNHEVGHWLGHDHRSCSGKGELAPLMQQQSISLQGCKFNAWPLSYEFSAPNLGIQ